MLKIERTNSDNPHFQQLVVELDKDLAVRNGEDNAFFAQYNKTASIKHVVLAYLNNVPVGCGAVKQYNDVNMEVKRMFVLPAYRGKGIALMVLAELELWCKELGFSSCILETGKKQPEAIALYRKHNYRVIPNFGQYADVEDSVCFEKVL